MWQKLVSRFKGWLAERPVAIPVTNKNVLIITAFIKKGIVTVSYKGQHKRALFDDNTLNTMMHGTRFDENSYKFFKATATLLKQLISK